MNVLGDRHSQCIEALTKLGSATAKEVANYMYSKKYTPILERNIAHPRLKELVDKDLVRIVGKKKDYVSNRLVNVYTLK